MTGALLASLPGGVELTPPMVLLIPLIGAVGITLAGRWPNVRETVTLITAGVLFCAVASLFPGTDALTSKTPVHVAFDVAPGLALTFHREPLGMLFAGIAATLWILNSVYSIGYMRAKREKHQTRFYVCFALAIAWAMGIAFSADLFTLFVFYELLTISTVPLVAHAGTDAARRGVKTYLGVLITTSVGLFLVAILGVWAVTGDLAFARDGVFGPALGDGRATLSGIGILFVLMVFGVGKAALMPFHRWLPAAMVAPTPVSALLHAVAVVKAGVFTVLKVTTYTFGPTLLEEVREVCLSIHGLQYAACFTILASSLVALRQDNLKRILAYSTIGQLAYIVLGASLLAPTAITGAATHMAMHACAKITLFFCAGAIYVATGKTEVSQMRGLGHRMPWTFGAFLIASLSIIGVPPLGGSWSKWLLLVGSLEAGEGIPVVVLLLSSLLSIGYLLPVAWRAFYVRAREENDVVSEAPWACVVPLSITALGCVVLFIYPQPLVDLAQRIAGG